MPTHNRYGYAGTHYTDYTRIDREWQGEAACVGRYRFFDHQATKVERQVGRGICIRECTVRKECRVYAYQLTPHDRVGWGVIAGMNVSGTGVIGTRTHTPLPIPPMPLPLPIGIPLPTTAPIGTCIKALSTLE